jgi:hypothetical protein
MSKETANDGTERLAAVRRYGILDTPPEEPFDRVTAIAARLLRVPIAIISIVDHDRIWFKSRQGIELSEVDRELGLCASCKMVLGSFGMRDGIFGLLEIRWCRVRQAFSFTSGSHWCSLAETRMASGRILPGKGGPPRRGQWT